MCGNNLIRGRAHLPDRTSATRRLLLCVAGVLLATAACTTPGVPQAPPTNPAWPQSVHFTAQSLSTWQTNGIAWTVASAGNLAFVGGTFTAIRPPGAAPGTSEQPALNFAVFDAATGTPTACNIGFDNAAHTATVRALNVSPDGQTLYVGGLFSSVSYTKNDLPVTDTVKNVAAIDIATCDRDTSFAPAVVDATVRAIASTPTSVFIGGDFTHVDSQVRDNLAKLSTSGVLDPTWTTGADAPVRALAIPPASGDNRLIVGGDFSTITTASSTGTSHALTILAQDSGAVVKLFGTFVPARSVVKGLAVAPDSSAFYTANEGTGNGVFDGRIAVSLSGPSYPQIWRDQCLGATQSVVWFAGALYSGSHEHDCTLMGEQPNGRRQHLNAEPATIQTGAHLSGAQPQQLAWAPDTNDGIGEQLGPRQLAVASTTDTSQSSSGDYLWVVGEFTSVNSTAQQGLTRFGTGPAESAPVGPALTAVSYRPGQIMVRIRAATDADDGTLTYRLYRDSQTTPFWTGTMNSQWWRRPQVTVIDKQPAGSSHAYVMSVTDGRHRVIVSAPPVRVPSSASAYDNEIDAGRPMFHWRLDESATTFAADSTLNGAIANNNNGVYPSTSPPAVAFGQPGALVNDADRAIALNGTASLYSEFRQAAPTTFSIEAWFKTSTTTGGKIVGFGNEQTTLSTQYDRHIIMLNSGQLEFGVFPGRVEAVISPGRYNNNQWHYVVATLSSTGMRLYVDRVLVASGRVNSAQAYPFGGYWRVGGDTVAGWLSAPTSPFFRGAIDEVAVYNGDLTQGQINSHWAASGRR